jgi:hypothetical protein
MALDWTPPSLCLPAGTVALVRCTGIVSFIVSFTVSEGGQCMSATERKRTSGGRKSSSARKAVDTHRCVLCSNPADHEWARIPVCAEHHKLIFEEVRAAGIHGDRPLYRKLTKLYDEQYQVH